MKDQEFRIARHYLTTQISNINQVLNADSKRKTDHFSAEQRQKLTDRVNKLKDAREDIISKYRSAKLEMLLVQADFSHSEIIKKKKFDAKLESLAKEIYSIDSPPINRTNFNDKKSKKFKF